MLNIFCIVYIVLFSISGNTTYRKRDFRKIQIYLSLYPVPGPEAIQIMYNSAEHEIFPAHKC